MVDLQQWIRYLAEDIMTDLMMSMGDFQTQIFTVHIYGRSLVPSVLCRSGTRIVFEGVKH